jgi:hypothetical protein
MSVRSRRVIDPVLTNHVIGFNLPENVGHHLFPNIYVLVRGSKVIHFDKSAFKLYNTNRAPGAPFKRIEFGYSGEPIALNNHGVDAIVPREEMEDADVVPGVDLAAESVDLVMGVEERSCEKEKADLARDVNNYDANHKVTLSLAADKYTDYANSTPLEDVDTGKAAIRDTTGVEPNVMVIAYNVHKSLKRHPDILAAIPTQKVKVATIEHLQEVFGVDKVVIAKSMGFDDAGNSVDFWGNDIILAYVPTSIKSRREPSYGYNYVMKGHPNVEKPYFDKSIKSWVYGVANESKPYHTGVSSGYIIKDAV